MRGKLRTHLADFDADDATFQPARVFYKFELNQQVQGLGDAQPTGLRSLLVTEGVD